MNAHAHTNVHGPNYTERRQHALEGGAAEWAKRDPTLTPEQCHAKSLEEVLHVERMVASWFFPDRHGAPATACTASCCSHR